MEIDKTDSHIFTATTTTTRMNISLETGKLRDTHSEGKVTDLLHPFFAEIAKVISAETRKHGYSLLRTKIRSSKNKRSGNYSQGESTSS
jgi:DNA-binding LacI/PurR family transcriptional regulator